MSHPTAVEQRPDGEAVAPSEDGGGDAGVTPSDVAALNLVAIQHRYEEAKACIVDPAGPLNFVSPDWSDPYPDTEKIDVRAVKPPVVPVGAGGTGAGEAPAQPPATSSALRRWWRGLRTALQGGDAEHGRPGSPSA